MKKLWDKHDFVWVFVFLVAFFAVVVLAITGNYVEEHLETPVRAVEMEKLPAADDISRLSQTIAMQFEGKPVRFLTDRGPDKLSFVVFDTEKKDFDRFIEWFSTNFDTQEAVNGVYFAGISLDGALFCSAFFSGIGDDSAQLTYIQVANLRKISAELWPEIVVN